MPYVFESLRADAVFAWRQIAKRRLASSAAVLSLGLAIGACTTAFRLVDAMLLRPLPVANAERLYAIGQEGFGPGGDKRISDSSEYPLFRRMRAAVKDSAELIAVSYSDRTDLTYGSDENMEKVWRQYVSGWMFGAFGLKPTAGRLLTESDDLTPHAHPYAVLTYDYWTRRFGRDPNAVGRKFRLGNDLYEIAGVAPKGFIGTEPGVGIDLFVPTMMNPYVTRSDASWFRPLAILKPGVAMEPVRARLHAVMRAFQEERALGFKTQTKLFMERFLNQTLVMTPAPAGISSLQKTYRLPLLVLGALVALVLMIACANVANLMTAQAASRACEMALRVSIGAGRMRLVQMVLVESACLGLAAAAFGGAFAWWAAPFVVARINPPDDPARLAMSADWRVAAFSLGLALAVTILLGLAPALRASGVRPASALKGGDDPHSRRRLMHALIAVQVAFCFIVYFAAGLFVSTLNRLANQPTGFSSERLLTLDTVTTRAQTPEVWDEVAEHLRAVPGVEAVALSRFPLLIGNGMNGFIWVGGAPTEVLAYFLDVSPGWTEVMKIPLVSGRTLNANDTWPGSAVVNETFVRQCLGSGDPVGKWFEQETGDGVTRQRFQVVGVVRDARYRNMREPITPTAYAPFHQVNALRVTQAKGTASFIVRTAVANPLTLAATLRREVSRARPEFRVSNVRAQADINAAHTLRERLLATLALFFAAVALLLSGVGLYGVLDYSVLQRRREIGIRIAIGAQARDIARRVTADVFLMVLAGAVLGIVAGMASVRYVQTLLYGVKATDAEGFAVPVVTIVAVALIASLPPVIRALRINPGSMLRSE